MSCSRSFSPARPRIFDRFLPRRRGGERRVGRLSRLELESLEGRDLLSGTWTTLTHLAPSSTGTMTLLSDGTVMAQGGGQTKSWFQLTPDSSGSYANGTWGSLASMAHSRLYFGSNVLPDGRVFVVGGEYSDAGSFTRTGEIYDPTADTWTSIQNFPNSSFGDDPTQLLPDGRILAGYLSGPQTYVYDPASDAWTFAATKLRNDRSDEETWIKLPDDSILSYDVFNNGHAQRYLPAQNQWVDAGIVPVNLSSSAVGSELGGALLLPDGRAFFLGATGKTAFYDLSANAWTAGPDVPNGLGADDAPAAMMPNGKVLLAVDRPLFHGPTSIFEFDPTTNAYQDVTPPSSVLGLGGPSYVSRMLVLPSGDVLVTSGSNKLAIYTPDGAPDPSWAPTITGVADNGDGTFTLLGTQLNGISQGASYGDDAEMDSNYPIVRLTDDGGNVFFARTFNWSSTGVATGSTPQSTLFTLPAGLSSGHYLLTVVANGIASVPVDFTVGGFGPIGGATRILPAPHGAAGITNHGSAIPFGAPADEGLSDVARLVPSDRGVGTGSGTELPEPLGSRHLPTADGTLQRDGETEPARLSLLQASAEGEGRLQAAASEGGDQTLAWNDQIFQEWDADYFRRG